MAPLRAAWSASTAKNSALWPLAVFLNTHGAILRWNALSSTRWLIDSRNLSGLISAPPAILLPSSSGEADPPWSIARDEAIPASATRLAEMAKSKQKTARDRDDTARFRFMIMQLPRSSLAHS